MAKTHSIAASFVGLKNYMDNNPRKKLNGLLSVNGHCLTHAELKKVVDYAVNNNIVYTDDISDETVKKLLNLK